MARFSYTGNAAITWPDHKITEQFICFDSDTGTLSVWANDDSREPEYIGQMAAHPAENVRFLHGQ